MRQIVYFLPGQGGSLFGGLGTALRKRGAEVVGRELQGEFKKLPFAAQVAAIAGDLRRDHWRDEALVVASSFGAYLFLHAQLELPPFAGRVLLLSPIVGAFGSARVQMGFVPPRSKRIAERVEAGDYPSPARCEVHVGSEDWQSNPDSVATLGRALKIPVFVVANGGHRLSPGYVDPLLDRWLADNG